MLAHDLVHDLRKQGKDNNILIKLDMSKAYDRISWPFLNRIMRSFGFTEKWCDLVFRCISNNWYSVNWENQSFSFFKSSCGVRQVDPLSPSLFILAMDWLSRSINNAVQEDDLKAYVTKRGVIQINHLLFADDILIFTRDFPQSVSKLLGILSMFFKVLGQVLNLSKSHIFFRSIAQKKESRTYRT